MLEKYFFFFFSWRKESERLILQLEAVEMEGDPAADMVGVIFDMVGVT